MFKTLYVRLALIAVLIALVSGLGYITYNHIYDKGAASVQVKWDKIEAERSVIIAEQESKKALAELAMKKESDAQLRLLNEKNKSLNATVVAITRELRNRPNRPSSTNVPGNTTPEPTCTGSTGKELYRADAEFLIGEAARAERLIILLESCKAQYNSVRQEYLKLQNAS
jgi:hypothetical protein